MILGRKNLSKVNILKREKSREKETVFDIEHYRLVDIVRHHRSLRMVNIQKRTSRFVISFCNFLIQFRMKTYNLPFSFYY